MEMQDKHYIPAPRELDWRAFNASAVLNEAVARCQELERLGDAAFKATAEGVTTHFGTHMAGFFVRQGIELVGALLRLQRVTMLVPGTTRLLLA